MVENRRFGRLYMKEKEYTIYIGIFLAFVLLEEGTMGRIILVVGEKITNNSDGQIPPILHLAAMNFNRPCYYYVYLYT